MRDPKRIEKLCVALANYWEDKPDLRLGQVLNILFYENKKHSPYIGDIIQTEDDLWLSWLKKDIGEFTGNPDLDEKYINKYLSLVGYGGYTKHEIHFPLEKVGYLGDIIDFDYDSYLEDEDDTK